MRFRSKPVEIEAMQWCGCTIPGCAKERAEEIIAWARANNGEVRTDHGRLVVRTIGGWVGAAPGHYVVMGDATFPLNYGGGGTHDRRDFYPCDPETFAARWEAAQ